MSVRLNSAMVGLGETPVKGAAAAAEEKVEKRADYLSWEDYFMAVASLSAQRSKDPSTQVGACIVSAERKVLGMGYNGMPLGCSDDELPWGKTSADPLQRKYAFVCHAEMNAIMNKISADLKGSTMYATLFPCNECAKLIIQAGIREVVYLADKPDKAEMRAARVLFRLADVRCRPFASATTHLTLSLRPDTPSTIHRVEGRDDSAGSEAQASSSGPAGEPKETSAPTIDSPPKQPKLDRTTE